MRFLSLPNLTPTSMICAAACVLGLGCGRKGDPIPRALTPPAACEAQWTAHRILSVRLPLTDLKGSSLLGVERVRIYYLPLGAGRPTGDEVLSSGELILERSRPDLPDPGGTLRMDLRQIGRPAGWIAATALRVGDVMGAPSTPQPWLDAAIR